MVKLSNTVQRMVDQINPRQLRNNTQRVLFALLTSSEEWVSRTSLRIPSASARLRDLRKEEYGSFLVSCARPQELNRPVTKRNRTATFYRLSPRSVSAAKISKMFEGVMPSTTR